MVQKLFGTSGIRGGIASKVTVDLALSLGRALGTFLEGDGSIGVGTDARTSREMLQNAFVSGVLSTGVDVTDLGIAPMPTVGYYSSLENVSVSVVITASHNPPTDNGLKFFRSGREFVRREEEFLEQRVFDKQFLVSDWSKIGRISKWDIRPQYLARVRQFALDRGGLGEGTKVLIDAANGAATNYTPHLLRELGFSVVTLNSHQDGYFPGRPAEPSPKNLEDTMKIAADSDYAVSLCHDGDGDRLAVIDEEGRFIDQNRVIALFARDEVRRRGGGIVVTSIDTSSVIDEVVNNEGGKVVRVPLGSLQEMLADKTNGNIVFASEPWKPIFTELGGWMDGIAGAARFAQMTNDDGEGSCIKLMSSVPEYPILRDNIPCPDEIKPKFLPLIKEMLVPEIAGVERVLEEDGVRIEVKDGSYVLVRVSGTEPKARLYIGAKTQMTLEKLEKATREVMARAIEVARK
ncbi:MAG: phosphoglucosamine mutase [Candidatus Hodarchaeota archaeon]